jgi:hypothetical protein
MLNSAIDEAIVMTDGSDDATVARDMITVHGTRTRDAALVDQVTRATSWIRVRGVIQRQQAGNAPPIANLSRTRK